MAFAVLVIAFAVGSVVGQAKGCLSCVGLGKNDEARVQIRSLDDKNEDEQQIRLVLERLRRATNAPAQKLQIAIVESDVVNAASFGDSKFLVFGGLKRVPSSALDAILAHEVAHDIHQHSKKSARLAGVISVLTSVVGTFVGSSKAGMEEVSSWAKGVSLPKYNRDQELEADASAAKILANAGYGSGAIDIMRYALEWLRHDQGGDGGGFLDSHPSVAERVARLEVVNAGRSEPWAEYRRSLEAQISKEPSVAVYLERHRESDLYQLKREGLLRLDDSRILERTGLVRRILDASPEAICSGMMSSDYGAFWAALNLVDSDTARRLAELDALAVFARVRGSAELPRMPKHIITATLTEIKKGLTSGDGDRLTRALKRRGRRVSGEELCWASRALFSGIGRLRDTKAAAQFARVVARHP